MKSYPGTTMIIHKETGDGLILEATVESGTPITTAGIFAAGAEVTDLSTSTVYKNNGTTDSVSWDNQDSIETAEIEDAAVTPVKYNIVQAVTATDTGATTGTIEATTTHATVTSSAASKQVILPAPVVGRTLVIHVGANGFDLKSSDPETIAINGGTGAGVKSAIAANSTCFLTCVSSTAWKGFFLDADSDVAKIAAAA